MSNQREPLVSQSMSSARMVRWQPERQLRRRTPRRHWPYVLSLLLLLFAIAFDDYSARDLPIILLFIASIVLSFACENRNIFHITFMGAHYSFWIYPVLISYMYGIQLYIFPLGLCLYGVIIALYLTQGYGYLGKLRHYNYRINIRFSHFIYIYLILVLLLMASGGGSFIFTSLVMIVSFALLNDRSSIYRSIIGYFLVFSYVIVYMMVYWGGFGRLVVFGVILGATIIFLNHFRVFLLENWIIFILMGFGGALGTFFRFNTSSFAEVMAMSLHDSNTSPVRLLSTIYQASGSSITSLHGWLDQLLLFFLAGAPREFWPGKPLGFGYVYTIENLAKYLQDAGHSVAATFVGEHIYYLGSFYGIFGVTLSVVIVVFLYRFLCRTTILGGYGAVAVAIWLPTFYWGGMQAFSARFSLSAAPLVILYVLHRAYVRRTKYGQHRGHTAGG